MVMSESSIVHMSSPRYSFRDETSNLHLPFTSYPFPFYRIYYSWNKNIVHGLKSQKSSIPISSLWLVGGNSENLSREKKNIIFILCIQRTQILKDDTVKRMTGQIVKQSGAHVGTDFLKATLIFKIWVIEPCEKVSKLLTAQLTRCRSGIYHSDYAEAWIEPKIWIKKIQRVLSSPRSKRAWNSIKLKNVKWAMTTSPTKMEKFNTLNKWRGENVF